MNPAQHTLVFLVRVYQWTLSPLKSVVLGPASNCRFTPSCSQYAAEAVAIHGAVKGSTLAAKRLCRCHPWGGCGHDPVPEKKFKIKNAKCKIEGGAAVNLNVTGSASEARG